MMMMPPPRFDWKSTTTRPTANQTPCLILFLFRTTAISLMLLSLYTNFRATIPSVWSSGDDVLLLPSGYYGDTPAPLQQYYNNNVSSSGNMLEARRLTADPRTLMKYLFEQLPLNNDDRQIKPLSLLHVVRRQGPNGSLDKNDVVLTTHLSHTKFPNLLLQMKYWNGPTSVAVYIKEESEIDLLFNFLQEHEQKVRQASFHIVMEKTSKLQYPFNTLRQVALDGVESDYFLAMDVDFIPLPENCHGNLTETLSKIKVPNNNNNKNNHLFVLPAFSIFPLPNETHARPEMVPSTKREAKKMIHRNQMKQFHKYSFPRGHGPTQYKTWLLEEQNNDVAGGTTAGSDLVYEINVTRRQSIAYEPYVVGFKPGMPRYWEDFRGFGFDKISFFQECYAAGYRYYVLKDFFCAHLDHPTNASYELEMHDANKPYYDKFVSYMKIKYPDTTKR
eukprot:scaffold363_cov56-Cylindrotheca_fusiformis.AAC.34